MRFIVKCIYELKEVVLLLSFICYYFGDGPNRPSVVFLQGPLGKRDKHVEKMQGCEKSGQR